MSAFLDLPREVRTIIYRYCLVSKDKIIPYAADYEVKDGMRPYSKSKERLDTALLAVNHLVRDEAAEVFYGQNVFYLSRVAREPTDEHRFWTRHPDQHWILSLNRIRHVSFSLDKRNLSPEESIEFCRERLATRSSAEFTFAESVSWIQEERVTELRHHWADKADIILNLHLKTLEIDVSNFDYLQGCYRLANSSKAESHHYGECSSCETGRHCPWFSPGDSPDTQVRVIGSKGKGEAIFFHGLGLGCLDCPLQGNMLNLQACPNIRTDSAAVRNYER